MGALAACVCARRRPFAPDLPVRHPPFFAELHAASLPSSLLPSTPLLPPPALSSAQHGIALDSDEDLASAGNPDAEPPRQLPQPPHALSNEQLQRVQLPPTTYPSALQLDGGGVFLLEHAAGLFLLLGPDTDADIVRGLFGADYESAKQLPPRPQLPELQTEWSLRTHTIVAAIRARRPPYLPVNVIVPSDADGRAASSRLFTEDTVDLAPSYVDLLCEMHSVIQKNMMTASH